MQLFRDMFRNIEITLVDFNLEPRVSAEGAPAPGDESNPDGCRLRNRDNESMDKDLVQTKINDDILKSYTETLKLLKDHYGS